MINNDGSIDPRTQTLLQNFLERTFEDVKMKPTNEGLLYYWGQNSLSLIPGG